MTDAVEVSQADRNDVHRLLLDKAFAELRLIDGKPVFQGAVPYSDVLEAFARHRLSAEEGKAELVVLLVEAVDLIDRLYPGYITYSEPYNREIVERDALIARIREALAKNGGGR